MKRNAMKTLSLREAKATLSAVVEAAERGVPTTITKHGRPAAVVVPVAVTQSLFPQRPSFASLLMSMPAAMELERDQTPVRDIDL